MCDAGSSPTRTVARPTPPSCATSRTTSARTFCASVLPSIIMAAMTLSVSPPVAVALGTCPAHALPLRAADLPVAKRAVLAMLPTLAARLDRRGARVVQVRLVHPQGDVLPRRPCGEVRRSVLVRFYLPGERATPSLTGNPVFYVVRTDARWVIWFEAH